MAVSKQADIGPVLSFDGSSVASPLGIYGNFAATPLNSGLEESRRYRSLRRQFALQNVARKLIPDMAVSKCLRWFIPGAAGVELHYLPEFKRGKFRQLQTCKSIWACPVCASLITEKRRAKLKLAHTAARSKGLRVLMVTLTFAHDRADDLRAIVDKMLGAWRGLTSQRSYKTLRRTSGILGYLRALEVTHSFVNGWHPHMHLLVYVRGGISAPEFEAALAPIWRGCLRLMGLDCDLAIGCRVDDTDERVSDYIQKYGREPAWDETAEVTKSHVKQGRSGSRTPFQLLSDAADGDWQAGQLFAEFNRVFLGRCQLQPSRGLWELLLGETFVEDDELVEESDTVSTLLGFLHREGWRLVLAQDARAEIQEALDTGSLDEVARRLELLGISLGYLARLE